MNLVAVTQHVIAVATVKTQCVIGAADVTAKTNVAIVVITVAIVGKTSLKNVVTVKIAVAVAETDVMIASIKSMTAAVVRSAVSVS